MNSNRTCAQQRHGGPGLSRRPSAVLAVVTGAALVLVGCALAGTGSPTSSMPSAVQPAMMLQLRYTQIVRQVEPSVVLIQTGIALGSGSVLDSAGDIVTNNHVVAGGSNLRVVLSDGSRYAAKLVGASSPHDLAVVRVNATGLRPATFADSSTLAVGDIAIAIGNPLGLESSVTQGIISALGRTVKDDNGIVQANVIQTSAAINPGNSGGGLVNLQGQIIGIPTLAATNPQLGGGQAPGISFAIPSNTVHDVAARLITAAG